MWRHQISTVRAKQYWTLKPIIFWGRFKVITKKSGPKNEDRPEINRWASCWRIVLFAGAQFGTVISLPLSGLLSQYGFAGGWPSVFYVFGAVGTAWSLAFLIWVYEDPDCHKGIRDSERKFIVSSLGGEQHEQVSSCLQDSYKIITLCEVHSSYVSLFAATYSMDVRVDIVTILGYSNRSHGTKLRVWNAPNRVTNLHETNPAFQYKKRKCSSFVPTI